MYIGVRKLEQTLSINMLVLQQFESAHVLIDLMANERWNSGSVVKMLIYGCGDGGAPLHVAQLKNFYRKTKFLLTLVEWIKMADV